MRSVSGRRGQPLQALKEEITQGGDYAGETPPTGSIARGVSSLRFTSGGKTREVCLCMQMYT